MSEDNIIEFTNPAKPVVQDQLTNFLRINAAKLLQAALETEVEELINNFKQSKIDNTKQRIVRNGYLPERDIKPELAIYQLRCRELETELKLRSLLYLNLN